MSAVLDLPTLELQLRESLFRLMREKALGSKWFNITGLSTLDKVFDSEAETAARKTREWKFLHRLHCVNWDEMPAEVRAAVPALVEAVIETARADFDARQVQS